jgi:hypothetical protein
MPHFRDQKDEGPRMEFYSLVAITLCRQLSFGISNHHRSGSGFSFEARVMYLDLSNS